MDKKIKRLQRTAEAFSEAYPEYDTVMLSRKEMNKLNLKWNQEIWAEAKRITGDRWESFRLAQ